MVNGESFISGYGVFVVNRFIKNVKNMIQGVGVDGNVDGGFGVYYVYVLDEIVGGIYGYGLDLVIVEKLLYFIGNSYFVISRVFVLDFKGIINMG